MTAPVEERARYLYCRAEPGCCITMDSIQDRKGTPHAGCGNNVNCLLSLFRESIYFDQGRLAGRVKACVGDDPHDVMRKRSDAPYAGLENAGATCYAGAVLQALFSSAAVRRLVLTHECADTDEAAHVFCALRELFEEMEVSPRRALSPRKVLDALHVQLGVQQDPEEFINGVIARLQSVFERGQQGGRFRDTFEGTLACATTCDACGSVLIREEPFTLLKLPLGGGLGLERLVRNSFVEEHLAGRTCASCGACCGASRNSSVQRAPALLCLMLVRFLYDRASGTTRKVFARAAIPTGLDLADCAIGADHKRYRLTAVVCHIGGETHHGHYVTYRVDYSRAEPAFWLLNDGGVSYVGRNPFAGEEYLAHAPPSRPCGFQEEMTAAAEHVPYLVFYEEDDPSVPQVVLRERRDASFAEAETLIDQFQSRKAEVERSFAETRQFLEALSSTLTVSPDERHYMYISSEWLRKLLASDPSSPAGMIANESIRCPHGKVICQADMSSVRRISAQSWSALSTKYGFDVAFSETSECSACEHERQTAIDQENASRNEKSHYDSLFVSSCGRDVFIVSKDFEKYWKSLKVLPVEIDKDPTEGITCGHGYLTHESNRYSFVRRQLWDYILSHSKGDLKCFPSGTEPCAVCIVQRNETASSIRNKLRERRMRFLQSGPGLYSVVSKEWFTLLMRYINSDGPQSLPPLDSGPCVCEHGGSMLSSYDIVKAATGDGATLSLIPSAEWRELAEIFGAPPVTVELRIEGTLCTDPSAANARLVTHLCNECYTRSLLDYKDQPITIQRKMLGMTVISYTIRVGSAMSIETLRVLICNVCGIEPQRQRLVHNDRVLPLSGKTLHDLGIQRNSTLSLSEADNAGLGCSGLVI